MHGIIEIVMPGLEHAPVGAAEAGLGAGGGQDQRQGERRTPCSCITSAPRNSFHDVTKANSATVTMAGTTAGMKMRTQDLPASCRRR